jgi:hypothetical protein
VRFTRSRALRRVYWERSDRRTQRAARRRLHPVSGWNSGLPCCRLRSDIRKEYGSGTCGWLQVRAPHSYEKSVAFLSLLIPLAVGLLSRSVEMGRRVLQLRACLCFGAVIRWPMKEGRRIASFGRTEGGGVATLTGQ